MKWIDERCVVCSPRALSNGRFASRREAATYYQLNPGGIWVIAVILEKSS